MKTRSWGTNTPSKTTAKKMLAPKGWSNVLSSSRVSSSQLIMVIPGALTGTGCVHRQVTLGGSRRTIRRYTTFGYPSVKAP